jgi:cell division septum initiation protein DivIVA
MNDNNDLLPNLVHEDAFEMQMRGYSRRQVDEFIARTRSQIRDLEQRLARALDEGEELRRDLTATRQQLGARPPHEEISERIAQILKLADDEARSQKSKASEDIARQRNDAHAEAERTRTEAREQAERMLTAAQEQAERAITSARAEAEKTVNAARAEAERTTTEARRKSDDLLAAAKAQAKKALDEATARATAIHDGAERRLNLLSNRHAETVKRLSDILDGVSALVTAETTRLSLEEEVDQAAAKAIGAGARSAPSHSRRRRRISRPSRAPRSSIRTRPRASGS